jgi:hypothetical protein
LSTTYLLQYSKELRELVVLIVQLRERDKEDKVSVTKMIWILSPGSVMTVYHSQLIEVLDKCGRFSVDLAHLASEASETTAASAIAEFVQYV